MTQGARGTEGFQPRAIAGQAFEDWPRAAGLLRPGLRHDRSEDIAWVCLSRTETYDPVRAWVGDFEGLGLLAHVDADGYLLGLGVRDATLHLPPASFVPGAMAALPMRFSPEEDALQVMFHQGELMSDVKVLRWTRPSGDGSAFLLREGAGMLSGVVFTPAHLLLHPSLLEDPNQAPSPN